MHFITSHVPRSAASHIALITQVTCHAGLRIYRTAGVCTCPVCKALPTSVWVDWPVDQSYPSFEHAYAARFTLGQRLVQLGGPVLWYEDDAAIVRPAAVQTALSLTDDDPAAVVSLYRGSWLASTRMRTVVRGGHTWHLAPALYWAGCQAILLGPAALKTTIARVKYEKHWDIAMRRVWQAEGMEITMPCGPPIIVHDPAASSALDNPPHADTGDPWCR
jgi:hypothetical protein